jgi:hypothetical protein
LVFFRPSPDPPLTAAVALSTDFGESGERIPSAFFRTSPPFPASLRIHRSPAPCPGLSAFPGSARLPSSRPISAAVLTVTDAPPSTVPPGDSAFAGDSPPVTGPRSSAGGALSSQDGELIGPIVGASAAAALAVAAFAWFWFKRRPRPPTSEKKSSSGDDRADTTILTYADTITREETGAGMPSGVPSGASTLFEDLLPGQGFSFA